MILLKDSEKMSVTHDIAAIYYSQLGIQISKRNKDFYVKGKIDNVLQEASNLQHVYLKEDHYFIMAVIFHSS